MDDYVFQDNRGNIECRIVWENGREYIQIIHCKNIIWNDTVNNVYRSMLTIISVRV